MDARAGADGIGISRVGGAHDRSTMLSQPGSECLHVGSLGMYAESQILPSAFENAYRGLEGCVQPAKWVETLLRRAWLQTAMCSAHSGAGLQRHMEPPNVVWLVMTVAATRRMGRLHEQGMRVYDAGFTVQELMS